MTVFHVRFVHFASVSVTLTFPPCAPPLKPKAEANTYPPVLEVSFVCVDPAFWGHGAGSLLMREIMAKAAAEGLPVYLEATEEAVGMYRKLGFEVVDGFKMPIPSSPGAAEPCELYREWCMVWHPQPASGSE